MRCREPQCNETQGRGHYCAEHQEQCNEIAMEKLEAGETPPRGHTVTCKDCIHYEGKRANLPNAFLCTWNNKVYTHDKPCFGLKKRTITPERIWK